MGKAIGEAATEELRRAEPLAPADPAGLKPLVARLKGYYGERISGELVQPAIPAG